MPDQCAEHNHKGLHIWVLYLSPNTSYMQLVHHGIIHCMKYACLKHMVCCYLQELETDSMTEIRKWNVVNVIISVTVAWTPSVSTVIHNCFAKGNFGIQKSVNKEKEDQDDGHWRKLQGQVGYPRKFHSISDYINMDILELSTDIMLNKIWTLLAMSAKWAQTGREEG